MQAVKIEVGKLLGKENWETWKYKIKIFLQGSTGTLDAVMGKFREPAHPPDGAKDEEIAKYNSAMEKYHQINSLALLLLTTNMSDEMLHKVMRYTTPKEVWDELHRLFDGAAEDRTYDLCMQFFGYKKDPAHDMASHISKVKNLWSELKIELAKVETSELPDILLICKISGNSEVSTFASSILSSDGSRAYTVKKWVSPNEEKQVKREDRML